MRRGDLLEAESRLYDLNIFDWSSVGPRRPITDQTDEVALVKVHEAKRNEITYGFGFEVSHRGGNIPTGTVAVPGAADDWLRQQSDRAQPIDFRQPARFHRIRPAATCEAWRKPRAHPFLLSRLDQRALTTYAQPHFLGSQWSSLSQFFCGANNGESAVRSQPGRCFVPGGTRSSAERRTLASSFATTSTRPCSRICWFRNWCCRRTATFTCRRSRAR